MVLGAEGGTTRFPGDPSDVIALSIIPVLMMRLPSLVA